MNRSREWLVPLTGAGFFVLLLIAIATSQEPKDAKHPPSEIVQFYVNHKDNVEFGAFLGITAGVLLIFFGAYLRRFLRDAAGERDMLSAIAFIGFVLVALGFAIDGMIAFAIAERAKDISPIGVQALQALWDNDFLPLLLGVACFLWGTGLSIVRTGVLPKWLGWVMVLLGILAVTPTPAGFIAVIGSALLVLILSVLLSLRARRAVPAAA